MANLVPKFEYRSFYLIKQLLLVVLFLEDLLEMVLLLEELELIG
jgi:hypothetical protein